MREREKKVETKEKACSEKCQRMHLEIEFRLWASFMLILHSVVMQKYSSYQAAERRPESGKKMYRNFYCKWRKPCISLVAFSVEFKYGIGLSFISRDICLTYLAQRKLKYGKWPVGFWLSYSKTWPGRKKLFAGMGCCDYRPASQSGE